MDVKESISQSGSHVTSHQESPPATPAHTSTPPTPPPSPFSSKRSSHDDDKQQVKSELTLLECANKAMAGSQNEECVDEVKLTDTKLDDDEKHGDKRDELEIKEEDKLHSKVSQSDEVNVKKETIGCEQIESINLTLENPNDFKKAGNEFNSEKGGSQQINDLPLYHLKWIKWKGNKCPIITQNENGPCPLIALMNVLILRNRIRLPSMMEVVTANQLIEYLGDCILENVPKNLNEEAQLNYEQNMHDAIAILPKLQTGLDVNVRFTGVSHFEYTPELILFDLLHIPLYHGWIIDSEDTHLQSAIGNCGYNQLVDKIVTNKSSMSLELVTQALLAEEFLSKTASQLTYSGLLELNSTLKDGELSVLFRNNHFITLYKYKDQLYQLMTDQGFLTESRVVWETLDNIGNDSCFVDADFVLVPPKPAIPLTSEEQQLQVDQDYLIALSLQAEQKKELEKQKEWKNYKVQSGLNDLSDEELARRLQEEEKQLHLQEQQNIDSSNQSSESKQAQRQPQLPNKRSQSIHFKKNFPKDNENSSRSGSKCTVI